MTERLTLPNGDWVDLTPRLNYAQRKRIMAARGTLAVAEEGVAAMIADWSLRDVDGQAIPFPKREVDGIPVDALGLIPADTFDAIAEKATDLIGGEPDPKGSGETSSDSASAAAPQSTVISPMPTSSRTSRAGRTATSSPPLPS